MKLEILTPSKKVLTTETEWVTIPGEIGEMTILPEHLPILTTLETGVLKFEREGGVSRMAVHYGYASVQKDTVTVLSEMVEKAEDIDVSRASAAEKKAQEELQGLVAKEKAEEDRMKKFDAKLKRSITRQNAAGH